MEDNSKNEELINGEWVEATPLKYEPNLIEQIYDLMPRFMQKWFDKWF